jgi:hypothetical protein
MNIEIDTVVKRARGYWFVDGFTEMAAGGMFILLAGVLLFRESASQASIIAWFLPIAGEIAIVKFFGIIVAILALWWLKDRFTYPRTGFVRGSRVTAAQVFVLIRNVILFILLPIFGLLTAYLFVSTAGRVLSTMPAWFPMGLGVIWALLCIVAGQWMGLRRFQLTGVMILLAGLKIGFWQFTIGMPSLAENMHLGISQPAVLEIINRTLASLGFLTLASGVILTLSGLVTFLRYRKENPTIYQEDV